jgi:hypothetical protein
VLLYLIIVYGGIAVLSAGEPSSAVRCYALRNGALKSGALKSGALKSGADLLDRRRRRDVRGMTQLL